MTDPHNHPVAPESEDRRDGPCNGSVPDLTQPQDTYPLSPAQEGILYQSIAPPEAAAEVQTLTPMQQGMLCQSLRSPEGSGVYVEQVVCELHEALDVAAFTQGWRRVVMRHPVLRTYFQWEDLPAPHQCVAREVPLPFVEEDWREAPRDEQARRLRDYLQADRQRGFDLTEAPLFRLALFRLNEAEYRCVWTVHHILVDGRSMANVLRELFHCYEALREGRSCEFPDVPPYRAYIDWLARQPIEPAKAFWREQLKGFSLPTTLPFSAPSLKKVDAERRQELSDRLTAAFVERELDEALTAEIESFAREHGLTLNSLLLGVWALVLSRYTGEEDVLFGATKAVRHCAAVAPGSVGVYINTLPFRVRIEPEALLLPWLAALRQQWIALRDYEHTPLSKIHASSEVPGGTALFEAYYVFEREPLDSAVKAQGGRWESRRFELMERTPLPLILAGHGGDRLMLSIEYDRRRFDKPTIERVLGHVQTVLEAMAVRPAAPLRGHPAQLKDIGILTADEQRQLLVDWQPKPTELAPASCIHHLFEKTAAQSPASVAVLFEDRQLTYRELNARANQLAHFLLDAGVKPDTPVGLCVHRSPEMVIGLLGILKAGGAYLPMDPAYPNERLAYMLEDAEAPVLVTEDVLRERLGRTPAHTVRLDADAEEIARCSEENPKSGAAPGNLCYIIYTSGSTGKPKGVMIEHQALVNFIWSAIDTYGLTAADRMLQFASLSFDAAAEEVHAALLAGATLVLRTEEMLTSAAGFFELCRDWGITILDLPTAYWHILADELDSAPLPEAVRLVIVGGEAARPDKLARWVQHAPPSVRLINSYGPTEVTVAATCCDLEEAPPDAAVPIGYPMTYVTAYVLDAQLRPVPIGVPGELYLGGSQLARGYVKRPDLTGQSFIPNPFGKAGTVPSRSGTRSLGTVPGFDNACLYRTGDRVRYQEDGKLVYLGRFDRQVKIRGFRIELGELEAVLISHPGIKDAAAVAREDTPGIQQLAAYIVASRGEVEGDLAAAVRSWLRERLPDYMQPSALVVLDELPLTASGKLDPQGLPAPTRETQERPVIAPRTPTESELLGVWSEVLRFTGISCDDDFFALGGDSLLAVQVLARMSERLSVVLPLQRMFEYPTINTMAAHIDAAPREAGKGVEGVVGRRDRTVARRELGNRFALTFDQEILWLFEQVYPGTQTYHIPMAYRIQGPIDVTVLARSLSEIVQRHEPLRTVFDLGENDAPEQTVLPPYPVTIDTDELGGVPESEEAQAIGQWLCTKSCLPFDVREGPLFRASLLHIAQEDYLLSMTVHHLVSDGWSVGVLIKELNALYAVFQAGEPPSLPELPTRYANFVQWQREGFARIEERVTAYWRDQLVPPLPHIEWPDDPLTREKPDPRQGAQYPLELSKGLVEKLRRLNKKTGSTLFMTLLAIYDLLLHGYAGATDILVAATMANRNQVKVEPLIGFFINTIALRTRVSPGKRFEDLLKQVREVVLGAYAHQEMPYHKLRDLSGADEPDKPLIQALFLMQTMDVSALDLPGAAATTLNVDMGKSIMDLTLELYETENGMTGWFEYRTALFSQETISRLAAYFVRLAETVAERPETRLSELPGLDAIAAPGDEAPPPIWEVPPAPDLAALRAQSSLPPVTETPPDATEMKLAELWRDVLGLRQVGRHDNFFDIGGHSLLAVVLLSRIEKVFGKRLRPLRLYQAPTIAQLARHLRDEAPAAPHRALHTIQGAGSKPPLFFVGSTDMIPPLVPVLGADQPLYSLNIFGLQHEDGTAPSLEVPAIAQRYIKELQTVQPGGPYFLAAYCRDAMVGYEMAQQLAARGEEVALLALIDAFWEAQSRCTWFGRQVRNLIQFGPAYLYQKAAQRRKALHEKWNRMASRLTQRWHLAAPLRGILPAPLRGILPAPLRGILPAPLRGIRGATLPGKHLDTLFINAYYDAALAYEPKPYPGRVTLLMASEWGTTESAGWERLAKGGVETYKVHACHHNIWEPPQVELLARQLEACIEKAQEHTA